MDSYQVNFYHLNNNKEEKIVCWFNCETFAEYIKFLHFCKKYEVKFYIRQDDENIKESDKDNCGMPRCVEDFNVNYGSEDCIQTIDVWLR